MDDEVEVLLKRGDARASKRCEDGQDQSGAIELARCHVSTSHQVLVPHENQKRAHEQKDAAEHETKGADATHGRVVNGGRQKNHFVIGFGNLSVCQRVRYCE